MKNWEKLERKVCELTGGKRTPGSGNKAIKGDVRIKGAACLIECKQTDADSMTIESEWLHKALKEARSDQTILVLGFWLRGYVYWHVGAGDPSVRDWKTMRVTEETLPLELLTPSSKWVLEGMESLRDLKS